MANDELNLDEESSIIQEIKNIEGVNFDEIEPEDLEELKKIIRDNRAFDKEQREKHEKLKPAKVFGILFVISCGLIIFYNILRRVNLLKLSYVLNIVVNVFLAIAIIVFLVFYVIKFKEYRNQFYSKKNER